MMLVTKANAEEPSRRSAFAEEGEAGKRLALSDLMSQSGFAYP